MRTYASDFAAPTDELPLRCHPEELCEIGCPERSFRDEGSRESSEILRREIFFQNSSFCKAPQDDKSGAASSDAQVSISNSERYILLKKPK